MDYPLPRFMEEKEESITESICHYLHFKGGLVVRIAPSGFFKNGRMLKHKSKFIRRGVPDILYWHNGKSYAFEVKKPIEHRYILKHGERIMATPRMNLNKKQIHIREQILIVRELVKQGAIASFVSSIDDVKKLIEK